MRSPLAVLAVAALSPLLLVPIGAQTAPEPLAVGDEVPEFTGTTVSGVVWRSRDHLPRRLGVVWFFPVEGPSLEEVAAVVDPEAFLRTLDAGSFPGEHLCTVGVVRWPETLGGSDPSAEELPLPVLQDPEEGIDPAGAIAAAFGGPPRSALTAFVVDPDGAIAARVSSEDWRAGVREAHDALRRRVREIPEEAFEALVEDLEARLRGWTAEPVPRAVRDGQVLTVGWRVREYSVHPRDKTGRWGEELRKEVGPENDGIRVRAWIEWAGLPRQLAGWLPLDDPAKWEDAGIRHPYWRSFPASALRKGAAPLALRAVFDVGDRTDPELVGRIAKALTASAGR